MSWRRLRRRSWMETSNSGSGRSARCSRNNQVRVAEALRAVQEAAANRDGLDFRDRFNASLAVGWCFPLAEVVLGTGLEPYRTYRAPTSTRAISLCWCFIRPHKGKRVQASRTRRLARI
jgi:hypothetical protein